ncbi:MAG: alpha/beta fold hydrolase [Planctomycetota bacterium]|nr:MAG: alpha/beta fold hydrolase [Planctomycetota bacterium]REJ94476.1 MAG: alpha/beta fold hydrolase [Planctomycetota bacterium]REK22585.1 MAG: alpha/beta fold hydrolase [Planctomycetota bacterium]REK35992.1 MAG: alpha/beta fold hydrolase [Planctomycetota bacterium]
MPEKFETSLPDWVPEFRSRFPWWGGHLQTLGQRFHRPEPLDNRFESTEHLLPLNDGTDDCLAAVLYEPRESVFSVEDRPSPLIVLLHGLGGTSQSNYIQLSADCLLRKGHRVLLINFRGAGESAGVCSELHHPGRAEDVARLLTAVKEETAAKLQEAGVVLVGYSLGGSVLLKYLGESDLKAPGASVDEAVGSGDNRDRETTVGVLGAVTISAPLDLEATSKCLRRPSRWIYQEYLLRRMREQALSGDANVSAAERAVVEKAESVWEFDEKFTAPRCGFDCVTDYYEAYSARKVLSKIEVPTLLIYAAGDPFVPSEQYHEVDWSSLPCLQPLIVPSGGHCGFQAAGLDGSWHDHCIDEFVRRLIGAHPSQSDSGR